MGNTLLDRIGGVGRTFIAVDRPNLFPGYCLPFEDGSGGMEVICSASSDVAPAYQFMVVGPDRLYHCRGGR